MTISQGAAPPPSTAKLPTSIKSAHGLGAVALGIKEAGLTTFFMIYYNQVLGFDPRVISLVLIAAILVDALVDPMIGRLSDATRTRFGRRLPWLYLAALPMAIAWALMWMPPNILPHTVAGLAINVIVVRVLVSACEIPSISLVAELTRDYDERTALMRFRFLFGWLGGLAATALAYGYFLKSDTPGVNGLLDASGYLGFGLFGAAVLLISTLFSALGQHRRVLELPAQPDTAGHGKGMLADIFFAFRNRSFLALFGGALFLITSYATAIAGINYMMLYVWRASDQQLAWYPLGLAVAVFGAFFAVGRAHRRFGKRDTAIRGALASGGVWLILYGARNLGWWPELGEWPSMVLMLAMMTFALWALIIAHISCASMVAEVVEAHEFEHGVRMEGVFFSGYLMAQKFGQALGIFLVGQLVALAGLSERIDPDALSPNVAAAMGWAFGAAMLVFALIAVVFLRGYAIDRAGHEARLAQLGHGAPKDDAQS